MNSANVGSKPAHPSQIAAVAQNARLRWAAILLLCAAAGPACSLSGGTAAPGALAADATPSSVNLAAGLEGLSYYRATLHVEFNGRQDNAPVSWTQDLRLDSDRPASARLLSIERTGFDGGSASEKTLYGQFGTMSITRRSVDGDCSAAMDEPPLNIPDPAGMLRPYRDAVFSNSPEERNGVPALGATLDAKAVGAGPQAKVNGEVWVAAEGGYIVHYVLEITGAEAEFGKGVEGVMRWEYDVESAQESLNLLPPPGCPLGLVDAPLPDGAADVDSQPGFMSLTSALDVTAAAKFYRERLPALGWVESPGNYLSKYAARLVFTKPDRRLLILIQEGPPTEIWITFERLASPG